MNLLDQSPRRVFLAVFLVCAGLIGSGVVLQQVAGIEPCPMCIMQRYAFVVTGLVALAAALHNPAGWGRRLYALLMLAGAATGAGIAARQSWIQHFPPKVTECGPDLEFMLGSFPLADALPMIFRGAGDCSRVDWTFLSLSIAEWALIWFVAIGLASAWMLFRRAP